MDMLDDTKGYSLPFTGAYSEIRRGEAYPELELPSVTEAIPFDKSALPLLYVTPHDWALGVLRDSLSLLSDHAHLEKKAAANALELLTRWTKEDDHLLWTKRLVGIARDESLHLEMVLKMLSERGGVLSKVHYNPYAQELRKCVRRGLGPLETLDRLLTSAVIECRSCERFFLLTTTTSDMPLRRFYRKLISSEAGHYRDFLLLAEALISKDEVDSRWGYILEVEAEIISKQPAAPRMHSGVN